MTYRLPQFLLRRLNTRPYFMGSLSYGDERCHACHAENSVWFVDSEIWNAVMDDDGGILCPTCFMIVAEARELVEPNVIWKLVPQAQPPSIPKRRR